MNKKVIIGGIAVLSITAIIGGQASASYNKQSTVSKTKIEQSKKGLHLGSGEHIGSGLHLGSGEHMGGRFGSGHRPEFMSGDKEHTGSGNKIHFGSGDKARSGEKPNFGSGMMRSGEKKDHFGSGAILNTGTKVKLENTKIHKTEKVSKKMTKKATKKK